MTPLDYLRLTRPAMYTGVDIETPGALDLGLSAIATSLSCCACRPDAGQRQESATCRLSDGPKY